MGDDLMFVFKLDAKGRVGKQFGNDAREFEDFFFRHVGYVFLCLDADALGVLEKFGGNYTIAAVL
jgi:hypothetical protein